MEADNKLVHQLVVDDKQRQNSRNQLKEQSNSQGRWNDKRRDKGQQQYGDFSDSLRSPTPGPSHRDRSFGRDESSRGNNRQGKKHLLSAKTVDKMNTYRVMVESYYCVEFPSLEMKVLFQKEKHWEVHGNRCAGLIDSASNVSFLSWSHTKN